MEGCMEYQREEVVGATLVKNDYHSSWDAIVQRVVGHPLQGGSL